MQIEFANKILFEEAQRVSALHSYFILDTDEESDFDDLAHLASSIGHVPIALVSLVDRDRLWFKSHIGLAIRQTPTEHSFCAQAIKGGNTPLVVPDATTDTRFVNNPLVTGSDRIVFYAGIPLINAEGIALGTLCVMDHRPRQLSPEQVEALHILARQVITKLELRRKIHQLDDSHHAAVDAKERLDLAIDAAKLGSYTLDLRTNRMDCSPQCKKNFGISPQSDFHFPDLLNAILPEFRAMVQQKVANAIENREIYKAEYGILWPDGSKHWISASGKVRFDNMGQPIGVVGVTADITDRKLTEQRKDDFLGIASHELKSPLTSLKANLQLLDRLRDDLSNDVVPVLISSALKSMERANFIVDDLLDINRLTEGQLSLNKTSVNIAALAQNCYQQVKWNGRHELVIEGDRCLELMADEQRLAQVMVNLINNAAKYAPDSRQIIVDVRQENHYAKISVTDTGPGIPADQLPHLFERYWRANHSEKNYSGLGLGLYICAEIIKKHQGEIGVDSVVGQGTSFWFTLPLV